MMRAFTHHPRFIVVKQKQQLQGESARPSSHSSTGACDNNNRRLGETLSLLRSAVAHVDTFKSRNSILEMSNETLVNIFDNKCKENVRNIERARKAEEDLEKSESLVAQLRTHNDDLISTVVDKTNQLLVADDMLSDLVERVDKIEQVLENANEEVGFLMHENRALEKALVKECTASKEMESELASSKKEITRLRNLQLVSSQNMIGQVCRLKEALAATTTRNLQLVLSPNNTVDQVCHPKESLAAATTRSPMRSDQEWAEIQYNLETRLAQVEADLQKEREQNHYKAPCRRRRSRFEFEDGDEEVAMVEGSLPKKNKEHHATGLSLASILNLDYLL